MALPNEVANRLANTVAAEIANDPAKIEQYRQMVDPELMDAWENEQNFLERDYIISELRVRKLFPSAAVDAWNNETGAYPDIKDPMFLQKLLAKREFADSLQKTWEPRTDPCTDDTTFEVTPVQRFVTNFMSPKTPYMSALLYHGVGVGKTCAAIQITEAWLEFFPTQQVIIVTPPTIKKGFLRTIFDLSKVIIGTGNEPNSASQCTGINYMKITNTLYERDKDKIRRAVERAITKRYKFFGYIAFANYISGLLKYREGMTAAGKELYKKAQIRKHFSGKFLIVDEAHNLRDLEGDDDIEALELKLDPKHKKTDEESGKLLTPFLRFVLQFSEGMKFCALTATPMYNTYREIIFMFNLLLLNDKKATLVEDDIFEKTGAIHARGARMIADIAGHYVSFMRGENPRSFPIRLFPQNIPEFDYPLRNPRGTELPAKDREYYTHLPIVPIELKGDALEATLAFTDNLDQSEKGLSTFALEKLVHACNFIVPATEQTSGDTLDDYRARTDVRALETVFTKERRAKETYYTSKEIDASWLSEEEIGNYSPKFEFLIGRLRYAEGCCFVYSRFVNGGAIPLALALEANGYTPYSRPTGMLADGIQSPGGRQCAMCPRKEQDHDAMNHEFIAAKYGLLTGDTDISPNNEAVITAQRAFNNADGSVMKVIIGSQIASEGVDLRFVRETHLLDAWYHLNKTEQILGRAIRFLSHCALPEEKRNNTVYLYAGIIPDDERETSDLYSYRVGFKKAVLIGNVTRIMKQSALDCNLNHDAIIISGQDPVEQRDSQRVVRQDVNINDMPFTAVCDWIENCDYKCNPEIDVAAIPKDDSSYDEFSARWRMHQVKERIKRLFVQQSFYESANIMDMFKDVPRMALTSVFNEIVNNKAFQVIHNNIKGYIRYCNGYYIFQPNVYMDLSIPLAIRSAQFPIKRDMYIPFQYDAEQIVEIEHSNVNESIDEIWAALSGWIGELSANPKPRLIPVDVHNWYTTLSNDNEDLLELYKQILEMVAWFHVAFHRSSGQNADGFRKTLLCYFWDEWLSIAEQKHLIQAGVRDCIMDTQYQFQKRTANRFIDPKTGKMEYIFSDGEPCAQVHIDMILKDKRDIAQNFVINADTTGDIYGVLMPKNGKIVFKHDNPTEGDKTKFKGKECAIVTNMTEHVKTLVIIGGILEENGMTAFDLQVENIGKHGRRKILNSRRACVLMDFILRYMNECLVDDKRWFFRAVQASYIGYKAAFRRK